MWLVRHMVGEGRLTRVLGGFERPRTPVHAVLPNRGPPPSKVRAFIEFLSARYKELGILSPEGLGSES
jgi:DNA-binding transcriptional LysR family regulator